MKRTIENLTALAIAALQRLDDHHEIQATEADAMEMAECVPFHDARQREIRACIATLRNGIQKANQP